MLALSRRDDWPDALIAAIERHRVQPFAWGSFDCATLFSDCVRAMTGTDPFDGLPRWASDRDAVRVLALARVRSVAEFCDRHFPAVPVSLARRGDLVLPAAHQPLMCPAIVTGAEAVSRDLTGWVVAPRDAMTRAWAVG